MTVSIIANITNSMSMRDIAMIGIILKTMAGYVVTAMRKEISAIVIAAKAIDKVIIMYAEMLMV